jgi:hypothetical protein
MDGLRRARSTQDKTMLAFKLHKPSSTIRAEKVQSGVVSNKMTTEKPMTSTPFIMPLLPVTKKPV